MTELRDHESKRLLALRNVSLFYEQSETPVLSNIDFEIHEGESVLFLGPSGCGKSTLAMLCANLIPQAIEARVLGEIERARELSAPGGVGYVFQDPDAQFCMLHVADEVAFGLENLRIAPDAMDLRIQSALRATNLDVAFAAEHTAFSGGMKQKLAIASALALDAKLFVFDEPTANLDPASSRLVFERIAELHRQHRSMIVIEHKFDPLLPVMDRVLLFDASGRIYRSGDTQTVVREEWEWLIEVGVVAPWKLRPTERLQTFPAHSFIKNHPLRSKDVAPAISIVNGAIRFGEHTVWRDVSLTIAKGSFTAVVGPNGAGKSTLLQVMRGLIPLSSGQAQVFLQPVEKWNKREFAKAVAYCFQNPEYQFIYERVGDELADRLLEDEIPEQVLHLLLEFGLEGCEKNSPFALSQGQKRRLSVAAMVKDEHEIYLLDEPTFGQDAKTQQMIVDHLVRLQEQGRTIVLTTHDMDLVGRFADQVIVVAEEHILYEGPPQGLFRDRELMHRAHLLDECMTLVEEAYPLVQSAKLEIPKFEDKQGREEQILLQQRQSFLQKLNPGFVLLASLAVTLVAMFAHTIAQALAMLLLAVFLMAALAWLSPWQILKRLFPFIGFYVLYVWSLTAFAAVGPHTQTFHFLFYRLSWTGFYDGVVLALRMLSAVAFGALFLASADLADFIVALSKNFHIKPKFAYGMLAGIRVVPLFQAEWIKLKQARQLRGKDVRLSFLRPVTYALPLLSQAIRMSERVAIAMEARGFQGAVAADAKARTYYRKVSIHVWDYLYFLVLVTVAIALLILV
ncbi:ATP-binding cassette domain-containing protein [Sulfoacidibacillus thermotolerans]|uniref:ABC transporter domain-containing protein n=1 Tax=Sulfoacidibacillus thermotolerans TaxID=1765684 RepID=A0A2U3D914_SULT2|nr:ATP-binding cassette domain-containing protein [Sulfoacidibacillus thermotolerans]PWI57770.1 hypothetical protein BM613_07260 [Sulfoacidibacillus thermotolerans]